MLWIALPPLPRGLPWTRRAPPSVVRALTRSPRPMDPLFSCNVRAAGVSKLLIGNVRSPSAKPVDPTAPGANDSMLQLTILPSVAHSVPSSFEPEGKLRVEAAWDSSAHYSKLLDRVSDPSGYVLMTVVAQVEVQGCVDPLVLRKEVRYVLGEGRGGGSVGAACARGGCVRRSLGAGHETRRERPVGRQRSHPRARQQAGFADVVLWWVFLQGQGVQQDQAVGVRGGSLLPLALTPSTSHVHPHRRVAAERGTGRTRRAGGHCTAPGFSK